MVVDSLKLAFHTFSCSWRRGVAVGLVTSMVLLLSQSAWAAPESRSIGFSNLVVRLASRDGIGLAEADFRVNILEELRNRRFNAVGAESLVFGKDHGDEAELLLGGTVRELECVEIPVKGGVCRLGIEWELLDVRRDAIVYRVLTRFAVYRINFAHPAGVPTELVIGALRSLMARPGFRALLQRSEPSRGAPAVQYSPAEYEGCGLARQPMPQGTEAALDATVVVKTDVGFGSGFFLNTAGYVVTAAHVLADASEITVKTRLGEALPAELIRISQKLDVALLRVKKGSAACFSIDPALPPPGADVYAIGSPASEQLSFSLTRGIVSGSRTFDETPFLQTDASISPGNSGGPLVNQAGQVAAIVSWKIVGGRVDGIAFGVPAERALAALGLTPGKSNSEALTQAMVLRKKAPEEALVDVPDPMPSLDPEHDARMKAEAEALEREREALRKQREEDARAEERQRRIDDLTPAYVKVMKWGGLGLAAAGGITVVATELAVDDTTTETEFESLRLKNDIGWVALGLGAASTALSFVLTPRVADDEDKAKSSQITLEMGARQVRVRLCY
jgi:S1-C subfamily serine protease